MNNVVLIFIALAALIFACDFVAKRKQKRKVDKDKANSQIQADIEVKKSAEVTPQEHVNAVDLRRYLEQANQFLQSINEKKKHYIDNIQAHELFMTYSEMAAYFKKNREYIECTYEVEKVLNVFENFNEYINKCNEMYIIGEQDARRDFFADVDGKSLDIQQQRAVITDEASELIIAGAGSGKTLTIVGKVLYLIKYFNVKPEEILVLAFNNSAANELSGRFKKNEIDLKAQTFHHLGLSIISKRIINTRKFLQMKMLATATKQASPCKDQ